jgi:hypothetical protein
VVAAAVAAEVMAPRADSLATKQLLASMARPPAPAPAAAAAADVSSPPPVAFEMLPGTGRLVAVDSSRSMAHEAAALHSNYFDLSQTAPAEDEPINLTSRSRTSSFSGYSSITLLRHPYREALLGLTAAHVSEDRLAMAQEMLLEFEAMLDSAGEDFTLTRGA